MECGNDGRGNDVGDGRRNGEMRERENEEERVMKCHRDVHVPDGRRGWLDGGRRCLWV